VTTTELPNLDLFPLSGARLVPVDLIQPGQYQPRKRFDPAKMADMTESVRKHGVMQPILLRILPAGRFDIVAGERRWRAATAAGIESVPAVARELTLMQVLELQAIENVQREDLHPLEEAHSYDLLMNPPEPGQEGYTPEMIADRVSMSVSHVRRRMALCRLLPQIKDAFMDDTITLSTAQDLARRPVGIQEKAWPRILATRASDDKPVAHKDAERILQGSYMMRLANAPFPIKDATLLPGAGGCNVCPKRTGANPDLFFDVPEADTCTDPDCHAEKVTAHNARRKADAREKGLQVIEGQEADALLKLGTASDQLASDYVYMDEPLEAFTGNNKSLTKLLGTTLEPSALFEHPKDLTLREIVQVSKAQAALDAAGLLLNKPTKAAPPTGTSKATKRDTSHTEPTSPADAWPFPVTDSTTPKEGGEETPRMQAERAWRRVAFAGVHKALHDKGFEPPLLLKQAVAVDLGTAYLEDAAMWDMLRGLWGWEPGEDYPAWADRKTQLKAVLEPMNHDMLDLLICELTLLPNLYPTQAQIDHIEGANLLLLAACADEDIDVDWMEAREEALKALEPPKKTPRKAKSGTGKKAPDPTKSLSPAGEHQRARKQSPGADAPGQGEDESQAPQGAQTMEVQSDLPHWVGQMVKVKDAKRFGEIRGVLPNGDLEIAFTSGQDEGSAPETLSKHDIEVLPGQIRPGAAPAAKSTGGKVPVKYRNPATGETWSGRGQQPKWVTAAIDGGQSLADFLVDGAGA
jgi:ParB/RepB/Spo0J family partition protein